MRNRFFFIILASLILAAVGINFVHVYFFKNQRLKLIDRQITESSAQLLQSREFIQSIEQPVTVEDTISDVLKGSRIGKVFILRDLKGHIVYQSFNASLLKAELPTQPEWLAVETKTEYVRVRNLPLPKHGMVLQVGLVLDRNFLDWEILDQRVINYVIGIVLALFMASALITLVLLSPLRFLIRHLTEATANLVNLQDVLPLPTGLVRYTKGYWAKSDEFSSLLSTVQKLIDRINLNYKLTRSWTLQMAHELKTPLAIMRAETESKKSSGLVPESYSQDMLDEIRQMSKIIEQFLDWAELESSNLQKDLHALRIKSVVKAVATRLDKISPGRIKVVADDDFPVIVSPGHLDQLIANLVTNALKFSPQSGYVELQLSNRALKVRDHGPGIPTEVMERMGEPFNVGPHDSGSPTGSGLGLAWISTVARLYQWDFKIQTGSAGTEATVHFPKEEPIEF